MGWVRDTDGLAELIRRIFVYYGFSVEVREGGRALLARQGSMCVEITIIEGQAEVGEEELRRVLPETHGAGKRVVASLCSFTPPARRLAEERGAQLWDRHRVEEEAGRVLVAEVDTRRARMPEDSLLEALLEGPEGPREEPGLPSGQPPLTAIPGGEAMVRPKVAVEEARRLAAEGLEGAFRFDLRLVPHFCARFSVEAENAGGGTPPRSGLVIVNGITGDASEWVGREPLVPLGEGADRMEPAIDQARAEERARERVVELLTRVVRTKQEKRSVTVYEKRTVRPTPEAVRLELLGLLYIPVWCVEGSAGALVIDALEGRVLKRETAQPAQRREERGGI
ncbi:MAG: hypothetical protein ACUVV6_01455 [Thermoplasmatota archaeon]